MRRPITLLIVLGYLFADSATLANTQTYSQKEITRFRKARDELIRATETEEYWKAITGLEKLLLDFPDTFLQGNITQCLFTGYSKVIDDPEFLLSLAEKTLALATPSSGLYEEIGQVFVDKRIHPERALEFSQKALELAEQMHRSSGDYKKQVIRKRRLLAKAYQLTDQPGKALEDMKRSLQEMEEWSSSVRDLAARKYAIDEIKVDLLRLYIEQKLWESAYELASDLLATSLVRADLAELWSASYIGRSGSAEGIGVAYAKLIDEREKQRRSRLTAERIKRPAPSFTLKTGKDDTLSLNSLKGKVVLVSFWAGWCGPCLKELPQLEQLRQVFKGQPVEFLAINVDTHDDETRKKMIWGQIALSAPSLIYLLGDQDTQEKFDVKALPYNCIIDQDGNIRYEKTGLDHDFKATLEDQVTWLLNGAGNR